MINKALRYFSKNEIGLWGMSVLLIVVSYCIFDRESHLTLIASLIGVTSLIFNAKGNPAGQLLMIVFSIIYGIISYTFSYYGEMITYIGMTLPMSGFSFVAWIKNPYVKGSAEVKVNSIDKREWIFMFVISFAVTAVFYFILDYFKTANMVPSTISVATSFIAVYLTFRRSHFYALGYAANDIVLIVLWVLASKNDIKYLSVVICFAAFLANDLYGFASWQKMKKRQRL